MYSKIKNIVDSPSKFYRQVSSRLSTPEGKSAGEKGRYVSS
jgi:hypothetical protein